MPHRTQATEAHRNGIAGSVARKITAAILGTALVATGIAAPTAPALARGARTAHARPNIVLILTDDQRWDTLSAMPQVEARLAARGVTFDNGFVTNSLCCPSRTTILTGQYSHTTGVYTVAPPNGGFLYGQQYCLKMGSNGNGGQCNQAIQGNFQAQWNHGADPLLLPPHHARFVFTCR